jgi:hypothetical protein
MALHEWHPFVNEEISRVPAKPGVYILYQVQIPLCADGASNLRQRLLAEKAKFPRATHFAIEETDGSSLSQRVSDLRQQLALVRKKGFVGGAGEH